MTTIIILFH